MPLPFIVLVIMEILAIVATAATVDELLTLLEDLFENYKKFSTDMSKGKQALQGLIDRLKAEILAKTEQMEEITFLTTARNADPQRHATQDARGRFARNNAIKTAIAQKIPFRKIITEVCDQANRLPIPTLREKKGVKLSEIPLTKRQALEKLFKLSAEQLAGETLEDFVIVRLRQLVVSLLFEFVDQCLDWKSPMKAEVSFGPQEGGFADHPVTEGTRLVRRGTEYNPFYPGPFFQQTGSLTADLIITEARKKRCDKNNIFALVEIKFPKDRFDAAQFRGYDALLESAAKVKTGKARVRRDDLNVTEGGRLSLFRYPEDRALAPGEKEEEKAGKKPKQQSRKRV